MYIGMTCYSLIGKKNPGRSNCLNHVGTYSALYLPTAFCASFTHIDFSFKGRYLHCV